ncbi:hypothetical protein EDD29_3904 [Actinocorallia herbida]|uniref:Uncharacterized protein n=1 Tax=Actinocorallia herbida TaxID=58109 RepID=A0A3N1CYI7_9ACTN|nr:hypothetical protein [Actinocorallia herbida]ROO86340.1 hypothetical protein EDD29_3904 [Actinocorallia herbida]
MSDAPPPARRRSRHVPAAALALVGLAALGTGGVLLTGELTREPTRAELAAAAERETHERWRLRPVGEVFPAEVPYGDAADGSVKPIARRVGIASAASCAEALDTDAARALAAHGCRTVLRATYVDATGTQVTTVGLVPLRDADAGRTAVREMSGREREGLRAVGFPETASAPFTDATRQAFVAGGTGRYLLLQTSGWLDDRPALPPEAVVSRFGHGSAVLAALSAFLGDPAASVCEAERVAC